MIQNVLALIVVFFAAAYTIFSIVKSLSANKASHCGGCTACITKEMPMMKQSKIPLKGNFQAKNLMYRKNKK